MKNRIIAVIISLVFIFAGTAFALTDEEFKIIQKAADEFLSNEPANGYHLPAEDVLKRIQSGEKDFIMYGYLKTKNMTRDIYQGLFI